MNDIVTVGDKVFIGGLIGSDYVDINNRVGTIEKITSTANIEKTINLAEINVGDYIIPVDFHYIYKLDTDGIDISLTEEHFSPIYYFLKKFRVVKTKLGIDEMGKSYCFCITMENNVEALTLTTLN